jgi:signal transduction histidine kinase
MFTCGIIPGAADCHHPGPLWSDGMLQWQIDLAGNLSMEGLLVADSERNSYLALNSLGDCKYIQVQKDSKRCIIYLRLRGTMNPQPRRRRMLIANAAFYLTFAAASARAIITLWDDKGLWFTVAMLCAYLGSLLIEPALIAKNVNYLHLINILQTTITLILLLGVGYMDFFALLFIPPCTQSVLNFPYKTAFYWIGAIVLLMEIALLFHFQISESVGYAIIYPAAILLFTGLCYMAMEAEEAQNRSEALLADLQMANHKLASYAAQVEELAAANERNRLARELHDSVTQVIFGLTLAAQAARILLDRDPSRVAAQLDHIQTLAQNALAEMRALIQQKHTITGSGDGLIPGLRRLAAERKSADGVEVTLNIHGERRLPAKIEAELLRITQEALNNIVKHAHTTLAVVTLNLVDGGRVSLCIEDHGVGFDPGKKITLPGHLGLTSISERVQALGGNLLIDSKPGGGTRLLVELALEQESNYDNA